MTTRLVTLASCLAASLIAAQDRSPVEPGSLPAPDQSVAPVKPAVEKITDTKYRIEKITFDEKTREIRIPASVNMTEGLLEFLVVHQDGKIHESLFITDISPTHLNLAFTLLRYKASKELYDLPNGTGGITGEFPDVPADVKKDARIAIDIEWTDNGKTRRLPANEWIQHAEKATAMSSGPWVYGGSVFYDGKFVPQMSGDIVAIFITQSSLINYPGEDNQTDTVWLPFTKRVPATGTPVELIFSPYSKSKPLTKQ